MKKTFTILIASLFTMMLITQPLIIKGQSNYTIGFNGVGNGTAVTTSNYSISDANSYVTSVSGFTAVYGTGTSNNEWRVGKAGSFTINLGTTAQALKVTGITINAKRWSDTENAMTVTLTKTNNETVSHTFSSLTSSLADYNWTNISDLNIKAITVSTASGKRSTIATIKVHYTSNPTITIGSPTGGTISVKKTSDGSNISTGTIASGTSITLNASPNTGYAFSTWNVTNSATSAAVTLNSSATTAINSFSMPAYNTTVNATFTKQSYNVAIADNENDDVDVYAEYGTNDMIVEGGDDDIEYGDIVVLTADGLDTDEMIAWQVIKNQGSEDVTASVLSSITADGAILTVPAYDITVNSSVEELKYIVTYKANGGVGSDVVEYYTPGTNVTVADNTFTYSGHVFKKWNTEAVGGGTDYAVGAPINSIAADVTLFAQWADAWTVTLSSNESTTTIEVEKTKSTTLTTPTNVPIGFDFKGWTATPSTPNDMVNTTYTPTANITLYAVFAKKAQEYTEKTIILDGSAIGSASEFTSSINRSSDGISYTLCPAGTNNKVKRYQVPNTASNEFPGIDSIILIGKNNAYIKNNTAFGEGIIKFEIYENKGAAASTPVGIYFSSETIASYNSSSDNTWTGTLTPDKQFDASSKLPTSPARAKYFWFQITDAANAQAAFRITYIAPVYYVRIYSETINATEDITITYPTLIQSGTTLNMGSHALACTNPANLIIEDGGKLKTNSTGVKATFRKSIVKTTETAGVADNAHWYAISSPVSTVTSGLTITSVSNFVDSYATGFKYNLFRYNESAAAQWEAYNEEHDDFVTLEKGRGYLYRNNTDNGIEFIGTVNTDDVEITLTASAEGKLKGFNLIGNPFAEDITMSNITGKSFAGGYILSNGSAWNPSIQTTISPCQGFLVQVDAEETITIKKPVSAKGNTYNQEYLQFIVANSEYEDMAYALFDKGYGLNKINHRNADVPMIFIPQNGQDYAIAIMNDNTKSFNLNFKAMTTGKYTLSYKATGEYNYLHIIDRLTGADVDMLLEGEYSFIATPNDDENRFIVRLEYMPNYGESNDEIFAFQNGNEILVSGEGELQIFDVTGRSVMTTTISGAESINLSAQGVYIFRLIGSEIKTQKIVVR